MLRETDASKEAHVNGETPARSRERKKRRAKAPLSPVVFSETTLGSSREACRQLEPFTQRAHELSPRPGSIPDRERNKAQHSRAVREEHRRCLGTESGCLPWRWIFANPGIREEERGRCRHRRPHRDSRKSKTSRTAPGSTGIPITL